MRTFGVELETVGLSRSDCVRALQGVGITAGPEDYSSRGYDHWQVKPDASLRHGSGNTAEVVSRILDWDNEDHIEELRTACNALMTAGATVNATCGLHMHVSVDDIGKKGVLWLVLLYDKYQPAIHHLLSPVRINGTGAQWCHPIPRQRYGRDTLLHAASSDSVPGFGKYSVINTGWYAERGTLEFRQRHGSVNFQKIMPWLSMIVGLVEMAGNWASDMGTPPEEWLRDGMSQESDFALLSDALKEYMDPVTWQRFTMAESVDLALADFLRQQGIGAVTS